MSPKAVLIVFLVCAAADFVLGYVHGHSIGAAITSAILGLAGTATYLWMIFRKAE
ncbi:MAG: hypothetical protein WCC87_01985 [Candidatus Korobacteraceae bacterium]